MQPSIYVGMSALPLNHNMKVDRKKLPQPDVTPAPVAKKATGGAGPSEGLQTETQKALAAIWGNILQQDADGLGPSDDFFVLGGSSLSAAENVGQARSTDLCLEFAVIDVLDHTNLADMARRLEKILGIESTATSGEGSPKVKVLII